MNEWLLIGTLVHKGHLVAFDRTFRLNTDVLLQFTN